MPHTQQSTDCEGCVVVDVNVILCGTKNIVRPSCGMQALDIYSYLSPPRGSRHRRGRRSGTLSPQPRARPRQPEREPRAPLPEPRPAPRGALPSPKRANLYMQQYTRLPLGAQSVRTECTPKQCRQTCRPKPGGSAACLRPVPLIRLVDNWQHIMDRCSGDGPSAGARAPHCGHAAMDIDR